MSHNAEADLAAVGACFGLEGTFRGATPLGAGHIHRTYLARWEDGGRVQRYVHQRINTHVFPDPQRLMAGIVRVTSHLARQFAHLPEGERARRVLTFLPARDGGFAALMPDGSWWRTAHFVEGARTESTVVNPAQAREAARAFGDFVRRLADLPGPRLAETIPRFHDTPRYLAALQRAAAHDPCRRAAGIGDELAFALAHAPLAGSLVDALAAGALPERVVHNDTKIDNLLFAAEGDQALCVVDLDTVMPGSALFDFGDLVRSTVTGAAEDATDTGRVEARPEIFAALVEGYLAGTAGCLVPAEVQGFVTAAQVITLECGVRFLTDHLQGDVYFPAHRPGHNLERARAQFTLLRSLERQAGALEETVRRIAAG